METRARSFRPRAVLRLSLAAAGIFWAVLFLGMWRVRSLVSPLTVWGCLAFVLFFLALWLYHARLRIDVDEAGVRFRGVRRRFAVPFNDILKVSVVPGLFLLRVYVVVTRSGLMHFSSHFAGHRELLALLVERAHLDAPGAA